MACVWSMSSGFGPLATHDRKVADVFFIGGGVWPSCLTVCTLRAKVRVMGVCPRVRRTTVFVESLQPQLGKNDQSQGFSPNMIRLSLWLIRSRCPRPSCRPCDTISECMAAAKVLDTMIRVASAFGVRSIPSAMETPPT